MKKKTLSRITACVLSLCLACVGFAMPAKKVSADSSQPVQLYYACSSYNANAREYQLSGDICVQNLGAVADRKVAVHYTTDGVNWSDYDVYYQKDDPNNSGYGIYSFLIYSSSPVKNFVVKFEYDGQTYWDNNGGSNYNMENTNFVLGKDNVKYSNVMGDSNIFVKNLAYTKEVGVRYTTDNWATYTDVDATYVSSPSSDVDMFKISIPAGATFAAYYKVNGSTYWDNCYGQNYTAY